MLYEYGLKIQASGQNKERNKQSKRWMGKQSNNLNRRGKGSLVDDKKKKLLILCVIKLWHWGTKAIFLRFTKFNLI